jgi:ferredoxin
MFNQYKVRVRHDNGIASITTHAQSPDAARAIVLAAERCPERSILSVSVVPRYPTKAVLYSRLSANAVECFYVDADGARRVRAENRKHGATDEEGTTRTGWYYWTCSPGCLPDSDPFGPFGSPLAALRDAYDNDFLPDEEDDNV